MRRRLRKDEARRIALGAQGFAGERPRARAGPRQFAAVIQRLGLVQLDSVNVCVRSHYMPFYARLGGYDREHLDRWLNTGGRHFEYWAHEASVMPVELYPLWRWRMREWQPYKHAQAVVNDHSELLPFLLGEIRERGPLTVKDLDVSRSRTNAWWGSAPAKLALEVLFGRGRLTALRVPGFTRLYDLPERAIPESVLTDDRYDKPSAQKELLLRAVRHHGLGTVQDLADYYRLSPVDSRPLLAELAADGAIDEVEVEGWKGPVYRDPAARCPRAIRGATLLSPFDPVTWHRGRAERLFDFRYRIEIYTPAAKRQHGYYVLPFLLDGELVARVDLKADRKPGVLRVLSAFAEDGRDEPAVARALASELERFAGWLGLGKVSFARRGNLMAELRRQAA